MNSNTNSSISRSAFFALLAAAVIWGATGPLMKLTLKTMPLYSLAFIRFFLASLILLPFVYKSLKVEKHDIPLLILIALFGVTFNISFFFWGLSLTTALNSGIIHSFGPILTIIFARIFLREKVSRKTFSGIMLSVIGISIIIGRDLFANGMSLSPVGDTLLLFSVISFVIYEMLNKKILSKYRALTITFYSFLFGSLSFLPAAIYEYISEPTWIMHLNSISFIGTFFGIVFSSFLAYTFWEWGFSKTSTSTASTFFYLDPITSTIVAVLLLSEKITFPFIIGTVFIFLGLFVADGHLPFRHHHPR